jgi:hypothetical protein
MKLSSLIHFATVAIPYVTADSMGFNIRAPLEMADVMNVKRKHESEEDFVVEIPVKWPDTYGSPEACMDEAGTLNFVPSNGECGEEPINRLVAIFNELIEGKNSVDISTPAYNLSVSGHLKSIISSLADAAVQFHRNRQSSICLDYRLGLDGLRI